MHDRWGPRVEGIDGGLNIFTEVHTHQRGEMKHVLVHELYFLESEM